MVVASLMLDGKPRLLCPDCSRRAAECRMMRVTREVEDDGVKYLFYEIVPPYTLDDCIKFAKATHQ